jgi:ribonuclease R
MERRADEAERELVQWKKVRFMADKVGDVFEGYITGVAAFGLFVELVEHFVEGLVHVSTMADDYYRYVESAHMLFGENTRKKYRLGDRVTVQVVKVDLERRQIDLGIEEMLVAVREDERRRGPRRTQARPKKEQRKGTPEERRRIKEAARRKKQRPGRRERAARER